ncbi:helix-turn-helix domain-containing protein [Dyadobacter frigoris]|uniref:Helix-turn-helix domain-containing protein n=1 Tax=Dyadobacter frigoris TaxID=2576211 RepID=A0A4U6D2S0_9BACT|nr:response regulator transcription factor [Dyadobacter frigoris]TKT90381.1 helix-turn-helix domain-containing protein [Dyadobacter frigoris]GLU57287.1 AraC family transcriptional regulator [Dyadobacter frigoris]
MDIPKPHPINTIAEYHRFMALPKPENPLVSVVKFEDIKRQPNHCPGSIIHNFYSIALKKNFTAKMKYGQQDFDFDEGVMHFMSPKQVLTMQASSDEDFKHSGWLLLIHPDFLWNTPLSKKIKEYGYFNYNVNEALHLSEKEEMLITEIIEKIAHEYHTNIDNFSQNVIIAQIELLLTYSERFYQRQFITRKKVNHSILNQLDTFITAYFSEKSLADKGIPSVQFIAEQLNISPNYLSRLLQLLTGQSTKTFIHDKLIDLAKEKLSTTDLPVNEIAYSLGFEHSQSFNKLFKNKTKTSPLEFRQSFNLQRKVEDR